MELSEAGPQHTPGRTAAYGTYAAQKTWRKGHSYVAPGRASPFVCGPECRNDQDEGPALSRLCTGGCIRMEHSLLLPRLSSRRRNWPPAVADGTDWLDPPRRPRVALPCLAPRGKACSA